MLPEAKMAYTTYNASTPQLYLDIDREKAKSLHVPVSGIFSTLSSKLSAAYINDFNLEGYSFKVKIQADAKDRENMEKILEVNIPSDTGKMIPMSAIATVRYVVGPRIITRFNQTMSASVNGEAKPGVSSGRLMNAVQKLADQKYPGYEVAWTDMSYQERGNDGRIAVLIVLALIFAYLFLVGQYESWTMPLSVLLSVSVAILGAFVGLKIHGNMPLSIYAQLGLVMLIGLSGKSAILMAEFSKQARENGMNTNEAAMEGGKIRYRAVMMTAWSFVIGVIPMVFATGAGSGSRQAIGVSTFWGMLFATLFGMMMVPPIWAFFQRFCDFFSKGKQKSS